MYDKVILCIDDEKTILNSLKSQLKRNFGNEYHYEFAEDANEGFEVIEELQFGNLKLLVIISDWLMPGMKGDEFLMKVHEKFPDVAKVMLTGQADQEAIDKAYKYAGLVKCIKKPWNEEELVETIRNELKLTANNGGI